jgi:hypothetical protein
VRPSITTIRHPQQSGASNAECGMMVWRSISPSISPPPTVHVKAVGPIQERLRKDSNVDTKASVETMAYYNMILTEAIFQLLEEKGLLKRQEVKDRIEKIKAETKLSFQMIQ